MKYGLALALLRDSHARAQLVSAVKTGRVQFCDDSAELVAAARINAPQCIILEFGDRSDEPVTPLLRRIRRASPQALVIGLCRLSPHTAAEIVKAVKAGLDELVIEGYDDLCTKVDRAVGDTPKLRTVESALGCLRRDASPLVTDALRYFILNSDHAANINEISSAFGIPTRTLLRRFSAAGMPTPRDVAAWARVLVATALLEDRHTVGAVAAAVGCRSPRGLRKLIARHLRVRPSQLRRPGSVSRCLAEFRGAVNRDPVPKPT